MLRISMHKELIEAGCDEAGRGCLAGPVFAAAVVLPKDVRIDGLDDSKKLSEKKRYLMRDEIEKLALAFAVARVDHKEIDKINILNASIKAMHLALFKLIKIPEFILIDGNRFKPYLDIPYETVVGGDGKYASIAAASVLAKTYRDEYMIQLHQKFPQYNWLQNKAYPTRAHREAVEKYGISPYHRRSFRM